MNGEAREALCEIIKLYGRDIGLDAFQCRALLMDFCFSDPLGITLITAACEQRVAADLQTQAGSMPVQLLLRGLTNRLCQNLGKQESAARWAVESWAVALGIITPRECTTKGIDLARQGGEIVRVSQHGGGQFKTIGEAIKHASNDAIIHVLPGYYQESLILDKPLELNGDGPIDQIIIEAADAPCIVIQAGSAVLRGMTLRSTSQTTQEQHAVIEIAGGQLTLEDCSVSGGAFACLSVHGHASSLLRRCRVHTGYGAGVSAWEQGKLTVEDADIFGHARTGIEVKARASYTLRNSKIHDVKGQGLLICGDGWGKVEGCEMYGNGGAGVEFNECENATFLQCKIHDGKSLGILACNKSEATLQDCEVWGHPLAEVEIKQEANLLLRQCHIHHGKGRGVLADEQGQGMVEGCEIFGHALAGVEIRQGSDLVIRQCKIYHGLDVGIRVGKDGLGQIGDSDIFEQKLAGIEIKQGGAPVIWHCRIVGGKTSGIAVYEGGQGKVEDSVISQHTFSGIEVWQGGNPLIQRCQLTRNAQWGICIHEEGAAILEHNDLRSNDLGPWKLDTKRKVHRKGNIT